MTPLARLTAPLSLYSLSHGVGNRVGGTDRAASDALRRDHVGEGVGGRAVRQTEYIQARACREATRPDGVEKEGNLDTATDSEDDAEQTNQGGEDENPRMMTRIHSAPSIPEATALPVTSRSQTPAEMRQQRPVRILDIRAPARSTQFTDAFEEVGNTSIPDDQASPLRSVPRQLPFHPVMAPDSPAHLFSSLHGSGASLKRPPLPPSLDSGAAQLTLRAMQYRAQQAARQFRTARYFRQEAGQGRRIGEDAEDREHGGKDGEHGGKDEGHGDQVGNGNMGKSVSGSLD